ncbi:MAG TPA: flagellar M-ring protein FliF [Candidatus Mediterraneibacter pullistercoris]|nr:flagellar M-ring protein FliF [Candidatus Mediterraneibacter pullistercoris]
MDVKKKLAELKQFVNGLDKKIKIISIIVAVLIIAGAIIAALLLNRKEYVPLFSELSTEEATEIVSKLQEDGVDYRYQGDGTILVEQSQADSTRASLVYEGYPSSGFTYDIFTENAGGMATDSEQQTYKLYELQNRIGATIGLFDGVRDAKVTIALGEEQRYVLEDTSETGANAASASVVVTLESGAELNSRQAEAIQRLVARSVPDMQMENVSVFDQNGIELSADADSQNAGTTEAELSRIIEQKIEQSVVNVLTPFYGDGNVRVSANGSVNMDRIIRETTTYTTPEKIDENDKTGIISNESGSTTESTGDNGAAGVAGTEQNADITEYNQQDGTGTSTYNSETYDRDYLVNQVKEQTEIDPGVMDDLTVSVSINGEDYGSLNANQVRDLVANATGITLDEAPQKITTVAAPFYTDEEPASAAATTFATIMRDYGIFLAIIAGVLLLLLVLFLVIRHKIKKRRQRKEALLAAETETVDLGEQIEEKENEIDILNMKNGRGRELRESIRDFAENNPEISAQMLRSWLNGGDNDGTVRN